MLFFFKVIYNLLRPYPAAAWDRILRKSTMSLKSLCQRNRTQWATRALPPGYRKMHRHQVLRNPSFRLSRNESANRSAIETSRILQREADLADRYLQALNRQSVLEATEVFANRTDAIILEEAQKCGIQLEIIPTEDIEDIEDKCPICMEYFLDEDDFWKGPSRWGEWASRDEEWPPDRWDVDVQQQYRIDSGIRVCLNSVNNSELGDTGLVNALTADLFTFGRLIQSALGAFESLEDERPSACYRPIKLRCGHIFELRCIDRWLDTELRCPNCRGTLHYREAVVDPTFDMVNLGSESGQESLPSASWDEVTFVLERQFLAEDNIDLASYFTTWRYRT